MNKAVKKGDELQALNRISKKEKTYQNIMNKAIKKVDKFQALNRI